MRFFIMTLGCKINQYESQSLRESWTARGWSEAIHPEDSDVLLVHTCAVTSGAVADSRGAVRRAARMAPGARIIATGCAVQVDTDTFAALPGVCRVVTRKDKPGLADWPDAPATPDPPGVPVAGEQGAEAWPRFSISGYRRARPVLKIQDGCSHCCTYCIVPRARGGALSRPYSGILEEARRLLAAGHGELILSGINLGQFRMGPDGDFWDMLTRLESDLAPEWAGRARLRLSSLDPGMLGGKAVEALAASRMVCPHLHLSMQSADPGVLEAMGRGHYSPESVLGFLDDMRAAWPVMALGADLLTGFPGESEEAFASSLAFPARAGLTYAHVFPYSRRPGTLAAKARGQLPHVVKKERAARLREETARLEAAFLARAASLPGLVMAVESASPGSGASEYYIECRLQGPSPVPVGRLLPVRPVRAEGGALMCEPL